MRIRRVVRFEFPNGTDIEFIPSGRGMYDVRINGVKVEGMDEGARPSALRARYYYEVFGQDLDACIRQQVEESSVLLH